VLHLAQQAGGYDVRVLATAANQMGRLHRHCEKQKGNNGGQLAGIRAAYSSLLEVAFPHVQLWDIVVCAQLLWSAAELQVHFSAKQQQAWEQQTEARLRTDVVMPKAVSNILWALGTLGMQPARASFQTSLRQALQQFVAPSRDPQAVANSLWGWNKLGWELGDLSSAAAAAVERTAGGMKAQEVSNTISAYANSPGWQLTKEAQQALRKALPTTLEQGSEQAVANALWGWSKLGLPLDGELVRYAAAAVERVADSMTPQAVSNTIYAFANGPGWQLKAAAQEALRKALPTALQQGNGQEVANTLWGWSKMGLALDGELAEAAEVALRRTLHSMVKGQVPQISQAYTADGWQLSGEVAALLAEAQERVGMAAAQPAWVPLFKETNDLTSCCCAVYSALVALHYTNCLMPACLAMLHTLLEGH